MAEGEPDRHGSGGEAAAAVDPATPDSAPAEADVIELSLDTKREIEAEPEVPAEPSAEAAEAEAGPHDTDAQQPAPPKSRAKKQPDGKSSPIVIDASDHVAGRLSSKVAKMLLQGNRVALVNCERVMISGTRSNIIGEYRKFLEINSIINPKHGPVHYRRPDTVMTKMIRGMLPFEKKPSGKTAHKRLRAYVGSPSSLKPFKKTRIEQAMIRRPASTYTTMGELCRVIGWTE